MSTIDEAAKAVDVIRGLRTLGLDADLIFQRIRADLERGLEREARAHLAFVDVLLGGKAKP